MAVTVIATLGGTDSNSYVTVAEADTFWNTQLRADDWNNATEDDKARALIMSSKRVDNESYYGDRVSTTQALKFPRKNIGYIDGIDLDDIIPTQIKEATYYLAIYMLSNDMSKTTVVTQTTKKEKVGSLEVEYATNDSGSFTTYSDDLPSFVSAFLSDLSKTASNTSFVYVSR